MAYTSIIPVRRLDRAVAYVQNKEKTARSRNSASSLKEAAGLRSVGPRLSDSETGERSKADPSGVSHRPSGFAQQTGGDSLRQALDYAMNRDKTEHDIFETGICCNINTVFSDMKACKTRWHKLGGVQGYHMVQSFAAGETTPEQAHQIGLELAERLLEGKYQAVVTTHLNTAHLHNHIVWNSVEMGTGAKYRSNAKSYYTEVRQISDELCRKYGLSVIETPAAERGKSYAEWQAEKAGQPTWRTTIRQDVDAALARAFTWQQFIRALESQGYEVRLNRKYPTLCPPGKDRAVRFKTLGKRYTPDALRLRILYSGGRVIPTGTANLPTVQYSRLRGKYPTRKLTGLRALYYRYLYELGALRHKPRFQSYAVRQDIRKLDETVRQMEFLSANGIDTLEQLTAYQRPIQQQIEVVMSERQKLYRHAGDTDRIAALTVQLKTLREEEKLCHKIAIRSQAMQENLRQSQKQKRLQRQQEQECTRKPLLTYER